MPEDLSFVHPDRLWLLVAVALVAVSLVLGAVRRRSAGAAYADAALLGSVAPRRPGWRRAPGQLLLVLSLAVLTAAWAEPEALGEQSQERSLVVLAFDASNSMGATDVSPDRFTAAKDAATGFLDELPDEVDAALVSFNQTARLVTRATADHGAVAAAVDALELDGGTAQGDAILTALSAVGDLPDPEPGDPPAARIVLLSDGANGGGTPIELAVDRANSAGVPVSTIAFGTLEGELMENGGITPVPVDVPGLRAVADATGGRAYVAEDLDGLDQVYGDIGSQLEQETARLPLSAQGIGIGMGLLLAAVVPSALLLGRAP